MESLMFLKTNNLWKSLKESSPEKQLSQKSHKWNPPPSFQKGLKLASETHSFTHGSVSVPVSQFFFSASLFVLAKLFNSAFIVYLWKFIVLFCQYFFSNFGTWSRKSRLENWRDVALKFVCKKSSGKEAVLKLVEMGISFYGVVAVVKLRIQQRS